MEGIRLQFGRRFRRGKIVIEPDEPIHSPTGNRIGTKKGIRLEVTNHFLDTAAHAQRLGWDDEKHRYVIDRLIGNKKQGIPPHPLFGNVKEGFRLDRTPASKHEAVQKAVGEDKELCTTVFPDPESGRSVRCPNPATQTFNGLPYCDECLAPPAEEKAEAELAEVT